MAFSALGHKNGNSCTVSPAAVVAALFSEVSGYVQRLIQTTLKCPLQLKAISIAEHGNFVILLFV